MENTKLEFNPIVVNFAKNLYGFLFYYLYLWPSFVGFQISIKLKKLNA
ncbi:MAG: hypothetical protein RL687_79 [Candidatus Parcubacteria bacterium]|jgi:hypothetical protein